MLVVPLPQIQADGLEHILEEEIHCWETELYWNYRPAAGLIRRYIASRSLPGHLLQKDAGEVSGYAYHVVDQPVGYIGNVYVSKDAACREAYQELLEPTLEALKASAFVKRIECQLFPFNFDMTPLFKTENFQILKRHFLVRPLEENEEEAHRSIPGVSLRPWDSSFFVGAAEVIYDSYRRSADHGLCYDYQSLRGCVRFLRNLVDSPGCGDFSPDLSLLAIDSEGKVIAVLVTSIIGPGTGMIPQISVKQDFQGTGLGSLLLRSYFDKARASGLKRTALSVSEANSGAHRLYQRLGFRTRKTFHAFVWNR